MMPQLRDLRERAGWTQAELARTVGVHANTVARWERGEVKPDRRSLNLLGYAFAIGADEIEFGPRPDGSVPTSPTEGADRP